MFKAELIVKQSVMLLLLVFSGCIIPGAASVAHAQEKQSQAEILLLEAADEHYMFDQETRTDKWNKLQLRYASIISGIELLLSSDATFSQHDVQSAFDNLGKLLDESKGHIKNLQDLLRVNESLLKGVGEAQPGSTEPERLTHTREYLKESNEFYKQQLVSLQQIADNAESLELAVSQVWRKGFREVITTQVAAPYWPSTIITAVATLSSRFGTAALSMEQWLAKNSMSKKLWLVAALILATILIGWYAGQFIHRRFGRNLAIEQPSHSRKLTAAVAEGIAVSLIPGLLIIITYLVLYSVYTVESNKLFNAIEAILVHFLVIAVLISICRAIFAPGAPQWKLTRLNAKAASRVGKALIALIVLIVLNNLFFKLFNINPDTILRFSDDTGSTASFVGSVFNILKALALIYLCRRKIWQFSTNSDPESELTTLNTMFGLARFAVIFMSVVSIVVSLLGYFYLGNFICSAIFITIIVTGLAIFARQLALDLIGYIIKLPWLRKDLGLRIVTLQKIKFWAGFLINPVIFGFAALIILAFWGVPVEKLLHWIEVGFEGFNIGELRISLKGILMAIIVFFVLMRLTRFVQQFLKENIFPTSSSPLSSQHNTLTTINYVGVMVALGAAIAALGIDFQTIALIMGALSVGIGFGLRNIVSNFISGMLLLVERPIKVGDWIRVGEHEGFVKELKFRSTELETFQQASVLIPNADLISLPVVNMTFADQKGRIEIPVGVAYGSDTVLVRDLLIKLAGAHRLVLDDPAPQAMFMNFGVNSLDFELRCFTDDVISKVIIASELRFQIDQAFRENGIEIPFPQRVVHYKNKPGGDPVPG